MSVEDIPGSSKYNVKVVNKLPGGTVSYGESDQDRASAIGFAMPRQISWVTVREKVLDRDVVNVMHL